MSDLDRAFRSGFEQVLADMPEPPGWPRVSTSQLSAPAPRRIWTPLKALAGGVTAVLLLGVVLVAIRGGVAPVQSEQIDYVKLEWSDKNELRCLGLEIVDNGGFDEATIEVWGPSSGGMVRYNATTPDGSTYTLIKELGTRRSMPARAWSDYVDRMDEDSPFRVSGCVEQTEGGSSSFSMGQSPLVPFWGAFDTLLLGPGSPELTELVSSLTERATTRTDEWRGKATTVYRTESAYVDELGSHASWTETWYDAEEQRVERTIFWSDIEILGSGTVTFDVIGRDTVPLDEDLFNVDEMFLIHDLSWDSDGPDESVVVTTSIAPLGEDLMGGSVEILPNAIPPALRDPVAFENGDQLYQVDLESGSLIVRLRAADSARMYAESCATLVSVELPAGWFGTCVELVTDGETQSGVFSYSQAFRALE